LATATFTSARALRVAISWQDRPRLPAVGPGSFKLLAEVAGGVGDPHAQGLAVGRTVRSRSAKLTARDLEICWFLSACPVTVSSSTVWAKAARRPESRPRQPG
jgi:hypothetical protein